MAVVNVDPAMWDDANVIQVDSNAELNKDALFEIDDWAAERNFASLPEYNLRRLVVNGQRVYRLICYRLTDDERWSAHELSRRLNQRVLAMPVTTRNGDDGDAE